MMDKFSKPAFEQELVTSPPSLTRRSTTRSTKMKKKSSTLPPETVQYLKDWMMSPEHIAHPYPTETEKREIMEATGIELKQLTNWFVNNRKRYWKPRVEARLKEQHQQEGKLNIIKRDGSLLSLADIAISSTPPSPRPKRTSNCTSPVEQSRPRRLSTISDSEDGASSMSSSSSGAMIIEQSSMEEEALISSDEEETLPQNMERQVVETIDVHILRPSLCGGDVPDLTDVTVLSNVPEERILRTYRNCTLQYWISSRDQVSTRRDAEIVRLKKQYLATYLAEKEATVDVHSSSSSLSSPSPKKRKVTAVIPETPRPHFRRFSVELWKKACIQAQDPHDDEQLPSLEEAATLFGFAK
jgi:hypothetical protein